VTYEIPKDLKDSIIEHAQVCYQCGVCMGGCPVARVNDKFHPRRLMSELVRGDWSDILDGEAIWLCAQCYVCNETCPQGVGIADLIMDLRNLAISKGVTPPESYVKNVKQMAETGRLASVTSRVRRLREKLELGGLKPAPVEEVRKLINDTKFERIIADMEEG
jgi:heterodisulfide reductase subunit C